jgi:hypothetical protein
VRVQLSESEKERQIMTIISENMCCFSQKKRRSSVVAPESGIRTLVQNTVVKIKRTIKEVRKS